jgi:N-acyl-D-amino-acid deacylase
MGWAIRPARPILESSGTVFDPETIIDRATFEQPHQYAAGVYHVLVNGQAVLLDGIPPGPRTSLDGPPAGRRTMRSIHR